MSSQRDILRKKNILETTRESKKVIMKKTFNDAEPETEESKQPNCKTKLILFYYVCFFNFIIINIFVNSINKLCFVGKNGETKKSSSCS